MPIEVTIIISTMGITGFGALFYTIYLFYLKPQSVIDFTWTIQDDNDNIDSFIHEMRSKPEQLMIRFKVPKNVKNPPETTVSEVRTSESSSGTLNDIIDIESIHLEDV